jgi:hypothetical protein
MQTPRQDNRSWPAVPAPFSRVPEYLPLAGRGRERREAAYKSRIASASFARREPPSPRWQGRARGVGGPRNENSLASLSLGREREPLIIEQWGSSHWWLAAADRDKPR